MVDGFFYVFWEFRYGDVVGVWGFVLWEANVYLEGVYIVVEVIECFIRAFWIIELLLCMAGNSLFLGKCFFLS